MKNAVWLLSLCLLLLIPFWVWVGVEGNPLQYLVQDVPAGQTFYIFSKLLGLYAFFISWLHIMWVILKSTRFNKLLPQWSRRIHQFTGIAIVVVILIHIALFFTAVSLRKGELAFSLLLPDFSDYYHSLLGLGVLALWLLPVVVYAGFKLKRNISALWLHRSALLLFVLIFFHGLGVGSETKSGIMLWLYLFMGVSVVSALLMRHFSRKSQVRLTNNPAPSQ